MTRSAVFRAQSEEPQFGYRSDLFLIASLLDSALESENPVWQNFFAIRPPGHEETSGQNGGLSQQPLRSWTIWPRSPG